jgi:hypothetical protein
VREYYRLQINQLSFAALEKEDLVRKLFDLFEPEKKAEYVFIPSSAMVQGKNSQSESQLVSLRSVLSSSITLNFFKKKD